MQENTTYKAGLYCRLSKDDEQRGESISIGTQRAILTDYCEQHQYEVHKIYTDDGYSGLNFDRPGFRQLLDDIEHGESNMVMLPVEISELVECGELRQKASSAIAVLMLEHQCLRRGKTFLILCVKEFVQRPPHIHFIFAEWFIFLVTFGSQI